MFFWNSLAFSMIQRMYHFFYSFVCQWMLGCFHVMAVVNSAAVDLGVHVSFCIMIFSGCMPSSGITGSYFYLVLVFLRNLHTVLQSDWLHQFTFSPTAQESSLVSVSGAAFIVCTVFDDGFSAQCEVIPYCSFDLYFSNNEWCWASFHVPLGHLYVFFGKMSV